MRITDNMRLQTVLAAQDRINRRLTDLAQKGSTGYRVNAPSDDPTAYAGMVQKDGDIAHLQSRKQVLSGAQADLENTENTLAQAGEVMAQAKALAVQYSSGDYNAEQRATAVNTEVASIRKELIALGNAKGTRGYLFAGTATSTVPFSTTGSFSGNDGIMNLEVASGVTTAANISGAKAFTGFGGGRNIFQDLDDLATALATNNVAGIQAAIDNLDAGSRQITNAQTDAGLALERIQTAGRVTDSAIGSIQKARTTQVEGDMVQVYSDLSNAQTAYSRSLEITKVILSLPSLASK